MAGIFSTLLGFTNFHLKHYIFGIQAVTVLNFQILQGNIATQFR